MGRIGQIPWNKGLKGTPGGRYPKGYNRQTGNCGTCFKAFEFYGCEDRKYCSRQCANIGKTKEGAYRRSVDGYHAIHAWVRTRLGRPMHCEKCGTTEKRRYEWANISGQYKREVSDWMRLCKPCHYKFDLVEA